jgi:hypothetical protein
MRYFTELFTGPGSLRWTKQRFWLWHSGRTTLSPPFPWKMPERQDEQEQYDRSGMDGNWWAPESSRSRQDRFRAPVFEPRVSQLPMNLVRDDPGDNMTLDTASQSRATTDSVWSFESMRDIHEFIREFNGRRYNAQNSTYLFPAGEPSFS